MAHPHKRGIARTQRALLPPAVEDYVGAHALVRVIDLYSVKPVDVKTLREAARVTKGKLIVVEDHYPQGGIGGAVLEALAADPPLRLVHLAVKGLPESGKPEELMNAAGITARHIAAAAARLAKGK